MYTNYKIKYLSVFPLQIFSHTKKVFYEIDANRCERVSSHNKCDFFLLNLGYHRTQPSSVIFTIIVLFVDHLLLISFMYCLEELPAVPHLLLVILDFSL